MALTKAKSVQETSGGRWFPIQCNFNCGGRCLVKVLVKDGEVIRVKTDDTHEDSPECPQARACPMGWTQWQKVFAEDRIKYPIKRTHWSPDEPNGQLRGRDAWERISWDEALDYIADELKRAKENFGNQSILYPEILCMEGYLGPILAQFGGYTSVSSIDSLGTYQFNPAMYGFQNYASNDRLDMENADYIVLYGHNPAWCDFSSAYYMKQAHDARVKFAFVGPEYNVSAAAMDAKWYPVRQGTDTAFLLGVAYSMIKQDEDGSVIDWDFLDRCTVGFDSAHMPADARTDENFEDYVLGKYDATPKTPEWASEICGCPAERIAEFALMMGRTNNVVTYSTSSAARNTGAENLPQLVMTISAMGGHFGRPGNSCSADLLFSALDRGPNLVSPGASLYPFLANPFVFNNPVDNNITSTELWDAVLNGKYHDAGNVLAMPKPACEREVDIHVIACEQNNRLQTIENTNKGIEAYRSVDFVWAQAYYLKTDAMYADIVLPVATRWERFAFNAYDMIGASRDMALVSTKVFEPMYESKSDYDIALALGERLGVDTSVYLPFDEKQGWFNGIATITVMDQEAASESGQPVYKPLVTITQEDIDRLGVVGQLQEGSIAFEEFVEKGVYRVKRSKDDQGASIAYEQFVSNPEQFPLDTPSGKMEIYCQTKSDWFDNEHAEWPNYTPVSPLPKLLPTIRGYIQSFDDWEKKEKGRYPYQISNSHYLRGAHTENGNIPWLREIWTQPVFISKVDALEKGIESGDIVKVFNDQGTVLRPASVSRCIMPGTLELPHGARPCIDDETGYDLAGCDNILTASCETTSVANNGWNSTLVDFEKYDGPIELLPDAEWAPIKPAMAE